MKLSIPLFMTTKVLGTLAVCLTFIAFGSHAVHAATTETLNCSTNYQIVQTLANQAKWEM